MYIICVFISGPKAAVAMSDKHNIIMHISGRRLPGLSQQSHSTAENISLTSSNKSFVPSPKVETSNDKVKKSDSFKNTCGSEAELLELGSDSDDNIQVHGARERNSQKRKVIVLDSDSDD